MTATETSTTTAKRLTDKAARYRLLAEELEADAGDLREMADRLEGYIKAGSADAVPGFDVERVEEQVSS